MYDCAAGCAGGFGERLSEVGWEKGDYEGGFGSGPGAAECGCGGDGWLKENVRYYLCMMGRGFLASFIVYMFWVVLDRRLGMAEVCFWSGWE